MEKGSAEYGVRSPVSDWLIVVLRYFRKESTPPLFASRNVHRGLMPRAGRPQTHQSSDLLRRVVGYADTHRDVVRSCCGYKTLPGSILIHSVMPGVGSVQAAKRALVKLMLALAWTELLYMGWKSAKFAQSIELSHGPAVPLLA